MNAGCAGKTEIPWERVPYRSALEMWSRQGAIQFLQIHVSLYLYLPDQDRIRLVGGLRSPIAFVIVITINTQVWHDCVSWLRPVCFTQFCLRLPTTRFACVRVDTRIIIASSFRFVAPSQSSRSASVVVGGEQSWWWSVGDTAATAAADSAVTVTRTKRPPVQLYRYQRGNLQGSKQLLLQSIIKWSMFEIGSSRGSF